MMSCFPCFSRSKTQNKEITTSREINASPSPEYVREKAPADNKNKKEDSNKVENGNIAAQTFTFRELATATKNFRPECLLGEGGFGRVYKATLESSGQVVAVKQLDRNGLQGNKEFLVEVLMLSLLHHQNLVNLIGYCADGDQRLLVYEYMSGGSLEDHLLDIGADQKPLDWFTRMKIASGAARGLEYLHDKANPPVIYRDFKSSNILLDEDFNPKLSDFGLAKLGSVGDKIHVSSRVMGTYGYCAPEYARAGELTLKSDVYSFGVVLLELITGRRAIDTTRPTDQQNLVTWAQPIFKDPKRFPDMADPLLNRQFTESGLNQAVAIAAMCLQEEAQVRPLISDVVTALSFLSIVPDGGLPTPLPVSQPVSQENHVKEIQENSDNKKIDRQEHHGHHDSDSSDQDTDSESDESDEDEKSEDERQRAVTEAKEWALNSSHRSSRGSHNGSKPSSRNSSKKIQDGSLSSSHNSSYRISSPDRSVSSRGKSNRGSEFGSKLISSHNGSRHSQDGSVSSSHKGSRKSQDESVSFSHNNRSRKAQDETGVSLSANSSRGSQDERVFSIQKTSRKSLDENGVSLSANSSRSSQDGSVFSIQNSIRESEDVGVSSIRQLSHKSSTKSQNERVSLSHRLSHQSSRGLQDGSVSSSSSSNSSSNSSRSGSGRVSSLL